MEASVSLKEAQGEKEESGDDQDAGDKETDEEECAKVAVGLENGTVVEDGDMEEQEQELELEVPQVLLQGHSLPPQVISSFLNTFPACNLYFQQHCSYGFVVCFRYTCL